MFTLPSTGQRTWIDPSQGADSVMVECEGGQPISHLQTVELWGWPVAGGGFRLVNQHPVIGMEGLQDSFPIPWPGTFYVVSRNNVGPSCASQNITVAPADVTGVGTPDETLRPVTMARLFDIHGRLVVEVRDISWAQTEFTRRAADVGAARHLAVGIYFARGYIVGSKPMQRRVVILK